MDLNLCLPNQSHASEDTICNSTDNLSHAGEDTICISNCVNQFLPCQEGHKLYVNLCLLNISHERQDTQYISTCVDQTHPLPARTQNVFQFDILSYASADTKCISTCVDQTPPKPARLENATQHVLTRPLPCQR
jgi:hypothetical protein